MPAQKTISPIDGSLFVERTLACQSDVDAQLQAARDALPAWKATPLAERIAIVLREVECFEAKGDEIATEITRSMGRPIRYTRGEVSAYADRARTMAQYAASSLADLELPDKPGFKRYIRREPLGLVLVLSPWNYPYLCAVNAIVPALLAGNVVVIKHSDQTPVAAERMVESFREAGLPEGVFSYLHMNHSRTAWVVADSRVDSVAFTGSVGGGHAVVKAASERFIGIGLELGGKDPAYVRPDADLSTVVPSLVDGAFFNSGQSCCAVERIYVHSSLYDDFVEQFAAEVRNYKLGDPLDPETTLGPVVRRRNAEAIRREIAHAVEAGATALIDEAQFGDVVGGAYLAPQVLVDVDHSMPIMTEETFGPVVGIMAVSDDEQAIELMNDSEFGLTASVWTGDLDAAERIGNQLETGTVFMNRCDFLDPMLAWVGIKNSGRGCTLSPLGFDAFTRPKSFHLKL